MMNTYGQVLVAQEINKHHITLEHQQQHTSNILLL